jgi:hypothetical protein
MARFNITLTRIDEYDVHVDETIWTPEAITKWASSFYPTSNAEELAKHLTQAVMNDGSASGFMEGFGYVKTFRADGSVKPQHGQDFKKLEEADYTEGLSIRVISENEDFEDDITQID